MNEKLQYEVAQYLYPFIGNTSYHNKEYYNNLIKKYGKKLVLETIQEETLNGNIRNAFSNTN